MRPSCCPSATPSLKALHPPLGMLCSVLCLAGWPLASEAARLRCGSELLSDLIFVCGDRGIYLGKGTWSGYGARPRGKGIVDQCCRPAGCELQHLEMYCAKPKSERHTTADPATASPTTAPPHMLDAVFQKRLIERLGVPANPRRDASRKKTQPLFRRKNKASSSWRKTSRTQNTASRSMTAVSSPHQRTMSAEH
ncbi:insulin-like growth factor 3 [Brachionichthys hirsutus]|uniref:insulin-like growth factor 3 n=1 Tax=Brachionichthys hirsutus TaxID=412623 RepID=UPI003604B7CE